MIHQEDVDFLEHFGKKGMKWGVRKGPSLSKQEKKAAKDQKYGVKGKKKTIPQKAARFERNAKRANTTLVVAAGAIYIASIIVQSKNPNLGGPGKAYTNNSNFRFGGGGSSGSARSSYAKGASTVSDILNNERGVKIDAINKTFKEGFIDAAQRENFVAKMNARYDKKIVDSVLNN
jgi:hypothetical protein